MTIKSFKSLNKKYKSEKETLSKIKLAILSESSSQFLVKAVRGYGIKNKINFNINEFDFDQIELQVLNARSDLYLFEADYIFLNFSIFKLTNNFQKSSSNERADFAEKMVGKLKKLISTILTLSNSRLIISNYPEYQDSIFGNYSSKINTSFLYQQRKLNLLLMEISQEIENLFIVDLNAIQSIVGRENLIDFKFHALSNIEYNLESCSIIAKYLTDIIFSLNGKFIKCLILDLDNTIWGGVISDDGLNGIKLGNEGVGKVFKEFQRWIIQLKNRGIILAVCSKNQEDIAKEPFEKHPEMIIKLNDISVFIANWDNKVNNINYIKNILNISFESMIFIDDNPFERNMVKMAIPNIQVPDLPDDPAHYLSCLIKNNFFEITSYSSINTDRAKHYQAESKRIFKKKYYKNENDYLESLNMQAKVEVFNDFNINRISELTQRSNQFNLRTIRYTSSEISRISKSKRYLGLTISLKDNFGDYGLISVVILRNEHNSFFIDTWIVSCRVLKRGVEKFIMNYLNKIALKENIDLIIGEYIPTSKNSLVANHYNDLNFNYQGKNIWSSICLNYSQLRNKIRFEKDIK